MSNLNTALTTLGRKINKNFPTINYGGCCVYAAYLGKLLEKKGWKVTGKVSAPFYASAGVDLRSVASNIKNHVDHSEWADNSVYFYHVFLSIETDTGVLFHDTDRTVSKSKQFNGLDCYDGFLTVEEMTDLANNSDGWNNTFERYQIPAIRKMLVDHMQFVPENIVEKFTMEDLKKRFNRYA